MVEIVDAILSHLDSDDKGLQNNAVRSLADIISKLSTPNCIRVVDRIISRITKAETKQAKELVEIYANGLVTIIKEVGYEYGYQLKDLVKMTVDGIFTIKGQWTAQKDEQNVMIQLNLVNIAEAFIAKWPKIIENV